MIGFFDYTVWLTYLGFLSGVTGIICAFNGNVFFGVICLMFSGLCDGLDGKVARTKQKRTKDERLFGGQLDSLSDLVCFGVLPSMIGYNIGIRSIWGVPILILFPLAALIRLAWFNTLEINRDSNTPVKYYTGLPVTASAIVFPFLYTFKKLIPNYFQVIYAVILLTVGILFISKIKVKKIGTKTILLFTLLGLIEIIAIILIMKYL